MKMSEVKSHLNDRFPWAEHESEDDPTAEERLEYTKAYCEGYMHALLNQKAITSQQSKKLIGWAHEKCWL